MRTRFCILRHHWGQNGHRPLLFVCQQLRLRTIEVQDYRPWCRSTASGRFEFSSLFTPRFSIFTFKFHHFQYFLNPLHEQTCQLKGWQQPHASSIWVLTPFALCRLCGTNMALLLLVVGAILGGLGFALFGEGQDPNKLTVPITPTTTPWYADK